VTSSGTGSLTDAVAAGLAGADVPGLTAGVRRLMAVYRSGAVPSSPVMASPADAAAYAAYRMPATAAATAAAMRQMRLSLPGWAPRTLLDIGAGTGGAAWAAAVELASVEQITLLEQSAEAARLGKAILAGSELGSLRSATWNEWRLGPDGVAAAAAPSPTADLATAAYLLGELTAEQQSTVVGLAIRACPAVLFVEPGTPAGHRRILAARALLLDAGYLLAAPCPHQFGCPLGVAGDWCHFAARLQRSAVHRQAKGAELSYEDEKLSYVAAVRPDVARPDLPGARVVRRSQQRKGHVILELCLADGTSRRELVSKSKGEAYRRARKATWGDRFDGAPE
jgi:ribosomal protein RSM22 (predicted rRNA methylase)